MGKVGNGTTTIWSRWHYQNEGKCAGHNPILPYQNPEIRNRSDISLNSPLNWRKVTMRGRKPKPTHIKALENNPGKRKIKEDPDMSSGLPSPPAHLDEYARQEWGRLAFGLHALGLLTAFDVAVFAAYCQAYSRWRVAEEGLQEISKLKTGGMPSAITALSSKGTLSKHPLVRISEAACRAMTKYAEEFGLTPVARARLAIDPGKGKKGGFADEGLIGGPGKRG